LILTFSLPGFLPPPSNLPCFIGLRRNRQPGCSAGCSLRSVSARSAYFPKTLLFNSSDKDFLGFIIFSRAGHSPCSYHSGHVSSGKNFDPFLHYPYPTLEAFPPSSVFPLIAQFFSVLAPATGIHPTYAPPYFST